jgi:RNA-directed DNA polymerase
MKTILGMNYKQALSFFLKKEIFFTLELPPYFDFQKVIDCSYNIINGKELDKLCKKDSNNKPDYPKNYENVNYKLINNKNGEYDWRPFEIIHPILYVDLVQVICKKENWNLIKKRFKDYSKNTSIRCCSIPLEYSNKKKIVLNWWNNFEQKAISNSLDYKYMACTDISNCYASIYTHVIPWAIHTKDIAKQNRNNDILGNIIDTKIRNMNYGQTNGIPQGSILMDFIAEIILGYADELVTAELKKDKIIDYQILRYRDDYKIFANDVSSVNKILKVLTEVLAQLNLKLNSNKTFTTNDIINGSIKKDKIHRLNNPIDQSLNKQKKLLSIYNFGLLFPNSGSLRYMLTQLYKTEFLNSKTRPNSYEQIISIVSEIMFKNPSTYGICIGILSEIFKYLSCSSREKYVNRILNKFNDLPNCDYLEIWLQRLTLIDNRQKKYNSYLCQKLYDNQNKLWNSDWLNFTFDESLIIDEAVIKELSITVSENEVNSFSNMYYES